MSELTSCPGLRKGDRSRGADFVLVRVLMSFAGVFSVGGVLGRVM